MTPNLAPFSRRVTQQKLSRLLRCSWKRRAFGASSQLMGGVVSLIVFFSPCTCIGTLGVVSSCSLGHNLPGLHFHENSLWTLPVSSGPIRQSTRCLDQPFRRWSLLTPTTQTRSVACAVVRVLGVKKLTARVAGVTTLPSAGTYRGCWPDP